MYYMEREKEIVCKTKKEYDRRLRDFIMTLEPKIGSGMYNIGLHIEKIKEYKKRLLLNDM